MTAATPLLRRFARLTEVAPLVAFRGLNGGMPTLIGLFIAHRWGLRDLGAYTFAVSFVSVGLMVVDWGCTRWLPRELALARMHESTGGTATANTLRLLLAAVYLAVTWGLASAGRLPVESARFALELGLLYPISIFSVNGVSDRIVQRHIAGIGVAVAAGLLVFGSVAFGALRAGAGPHSIVLAFLAGKVVEALLLMQGRLQLFRVSPRHLLTTLLVLWPFSIQAILAVIYARLSIFIVEHFRHADLGLMGVATALQSVLLLLPVSVALLKYPALTRAAVEGDAAHIRSAVVSAAATSFAGVTAGVAFLFGVRGIIARVLHIAPESLPFVLAFTAIAYLTIGSSLSGVVLQALGHEHATAKLSFVTLAVSLAFQFVLVQRFGLWGVLAAIAAAEVVSVSVFGGFAWRAVHAKLRLHASAHALDLPTPESLQQ